jgi:DNA-binding GntR family transcriptional regulator
LGEPKYREIAADLESKIEARNRRQDSVWPPTRDLGARYDASRNTVRPAIQFLLTRRIVEKQPSGATLVRKKIDPFRTVVSVVTGLRRFEGAAYASDVEASNRRPAVTKAARRDPGSSRRVTDALGVDKRSPVVAGTKNASSTMNCGPSRRVTTR